MHRVTRRKLLQAGAAGTVAAGIATATGVTPTGAEPARLGGIHIHGSLPGGPAFLHGRLIDVNVYGPDSDLSGSGWDADPETTGAAQPGAPDRSQCYFTQRGSVTGDTVTLVGRALFWQQPGDDGAVITTEANLVTGGIRWSISEVGGRSGEGGTVTFEGTGVVGRI